MDIERVRHALLDNAGGSYATALANELLSQQIERPTEDDFSRASGDFA